MVEVRELCKYYGFRKAVECVTFAIARGEVVGLLGPNGAGKTTTMKIIAGILAPTSGEVRVGGLNVEAHPFEVKRRIGYLPENPPVYTDMYVQEFLLYVARMKGVHPKSEMRLVKQVIERVRLGEVRSRLIGHLSKGFKQRVGLAQALVSEPEVLILDEPTSGMDPRQVLEFRSLIRELREQHTIIFSTHILSEVEATCNKVVIIDRGKIIADNSLAELTREENLENVFIRLVPSRGEVRE